MEFKDLLYYGRILKNENEYIRENLERLQNFTSEQKENQQAFIEYNLQYSKCIDFYG